MAAADPLQYRLDDHGRRIGSLEIKGAVTEEKVTGIARELHDQAEEFRALKRALYGLAISVTGGVVVFSFTVFSIWGN